MAHTLYRSAVEELNDALEALIRVSHTVTDEYKETVRLAREGTVMDIVVNWSVKERRELEQAILSVRGAMKRLRAHGIRVLVDEEGLSISEVACRMGISRQAVSALYHSAINGSPGD